MILTLSLVNLRRDMQTSAADMKGNNNGRISSLVTVQVRGGGIGFWDHTTTSAAEEAKRNWSEDRTILREVAEKIAELADRPRGEKKELWYKHNALENERPLILADPENGWNDIIRYEDILCKGEMAKRWEVILRKELFWANEIRDDRPVEKTFYIGYTLRGYWLGNQ